MQPYNILSELLSRIEEVVSGTSETDYLNDLPISIVHLRRLFKFAFGVPLQSYIRSRKLAFSLEDLMQTEKRVLDIAIDCGYEHEQTYIRAFKREYGMTPGECRDSGKNIHVTAPIHLFPKNDVCGNLIYGPEMVMIPSFHVMGRMYQIEIAESPTEAPEAAKQFWWGKRHEVPNPIEPNIYYGLTRTPDPSLSWTYYLPSMRVTDLNNIPDGFVGDTVPASMCVSFRYVGNHHYEEINQLRAEALYAAIDRLAKEHNGKFDLLDGDFFFEKVDLDAYDGEYCQMEWFAPIRVNRFLK
ncbi:helix-turn-helix domain-containing protein [Paenibacillus xylanilyticus]|uniref:Helix-turn-helix domain-containing protein n=1 Tax=Paenibacillus xylanilyticus TaxID=248903 RepID=A0A7Y6C1W8_9BACL|nr:helix-turn-helix domain-containing protein [Paenibacillus xylanilyticus]NUU79035.1 helix-turn-helix domain-containing protein [Paenibacillus xylanilyticus]